MLTLGFKWITMISKLITEYLKSNRRLILPTLGAFIKKDDSGEVVFVPFLKSDDGVMKSLISNNLSVSAADAEAMLEEYLFAIKQGVSQNGRFVVEGLGTVTKDVNDVMTMIYDPSVASTQAAPTPEPQAPVMSSPQTPEPQAPATTFAANAAPISEIQAPVMSVPQAQAPTMSTIETTPTPRPVAPVMEVPAPRTAAASNTQYPASAPAPQTAAPSTFVPPAPQTATPSATAAPQASSNIVDLDVFETPAQVASQPQRPVAQGHADQIERLYNAPAGVPTVPQPNRSRGANDHDARANNNSRQAAPNRHPAPTQRQPQQGRRRPAKRKARKFDLLMIVAIAAAIAGLLVLLYGMLFPTPEALFIG